MFSVLRIKTFLFDDSLQHSWNTWKSFFTTLLSTLLHSFCRIIQRSSLFFGCLLLTFFYKFSMMFRFGDCAGQSLKRHTLWFSKNVIVDLDYGMVRHLAQILSCCLIVAAMRYAIHFDMYQNSRCWDICIIFSFRHLLWHLTP